MHTLFSAAVKFNEFSKCHCVCEENRKKRQADFTTPTPWWLQTAVFDSAFSTQEEKKNPFLFSLPSSLFA